MANRSEFHLSLQDSLNLSLLTAGTSLIGTIFCALLFDRVGRMRWFTVAFLLAFVFLVTLAFVGVDSVAFVATLTSAAFLCIGTTNLGLYLYTPEIYPTRMRALGVSWASFWLRMAATVGPLIVGFTLPRYGIGGVFLAFSIFAIIGCAAATYMIETRRRVLEEVSP